MATLAAERNMSEYNRFDYTSLKLTETTYQRIKDYIETNVGIKLPPAKKTMLQARLQKRLRILKMCSFKDYCDFVLSDEGQWERVHMINSITTNKTDFFREPAHFDHLLGTAIPNMKKNGLLNSQQPIKVWSAGCSSGEEPYTLAMLLMESALIKPAANFNILASDISTRILEKAKLAIYPEERSLPIPMKLKKKYLLH